MEDEIIGVEMNEQIKWIKSVLGFVFEWLETDRYWSLGPAG